MSTRRKPSPGESAMGAFLNIGSKLVRKVVDRGVTGEAVHRLETPEGEEDIDRIADAVAGILAPIRFLEDLAIQIPALPRPTLAELQRGCDWVASIERDTSTTDPVTLRLGTVLRDGETNPISGSEYEIRLVPLHKRLLGFQHARWLVEHQDEFPGGLIELLGKVYIDFSGLVVVGSGGVRHFPCLGSVGGRWLQNWPWFGYSFDSWGRVAVSSK